MLETLPSFLSLSSLRSVIHSASFSRLSRPSHEVVGRDGAGRLGLVGSSSHVSSTGAVSAVTSCSECVEGEVGVEGRLRLLAASRFKSVGLSAPILEYLCTHMSLWS